MSRRKTIDNPIEFLKNRLTKKCCGNCVHAFAIHVENTINGDYIAFQCYNGPVYNGDAERMHKALDNRNCMFFTPRGSYALALIERYGLDKNGKE